MSEQLKFDLSGGRYPTGEIVCEGDFVACVAGSNAGKRGTVLNPGDLGGSTAAIHWQGERIERFGYCPAEGLKLVRRGK